MFTGIVEEIGSIASASTGNMVITAREVLRDIKLGGSVAVNGVCLTVTNFDKKTFTVDVMPETRRLTNLGQLSNGDSVNLERPLALGGEVGGHLVQGHVDNTGEIAWTTGDNEALLMTFTAPEEVLRYVVIKGFIAVDGVSLTVVDVDARSFRVSIVGFTRIHTTLGRKKPGDKVNLEADIIAKYVERLGQPRHTGITADFLQEHGFPVNTRF